MQVVATKDPPPQKKASSLSGLADPSLLVLFWVRHFVIQWGTRGVLQGQGSEGIDQ